MPATNYSRDALVQLCLETAHFDSERATAMLNGVVRQNGHFLVMAASVPPGARERSLEWGKFVHRFSADKWIRAHGKRQRDTSKRLVARAFLLTPGLEVPLRTWNDPAFVSAFEIEARALLHLKAAPSRHNLRAVREHPVAGPIVNQIEQAVPPEMQHYEDMYEALLTTLSHGLPPFEVVERFGLDGEYYRELLRICGSDLEVEDALRRGEARQHRGHGTWSVAAVERILALLGILTSTGRTRMEMGEEYERYTRENNRKRKREDQESRGVWRIRRSETEKWRAALSADEWAQYLSCEQAMRSVGVTTTPRRHFNQNSLKHMRETNLPNLCAAMTFARENESGAA